MYAKSLACVANTQLHVYIRATLSIVTIILKTNMSFSSYYALHYVLKVIANIVYKLFYKSHEIVNTLWGVGRRELFWKM